MLSFASRTGRGPLHINVCHFGMTFFDQRAADGEIINSLRLEHRFSFHAFRRSIFLLGNMKNNRMKVNIRTWTVHEIPHMRPQLQPHLHIMLQVHARIGR